MLYGGKAVVLVKNPYDAILSYFRHRVYGIHSDTEGADMPQYWTKHKMKSVNESVNPFYSELFEQFAVEMSEEWARSVLGINTSGKPYQITYF